MPLKPMKKLLLYSLFSFFFSISFSQEIAIYDFEDLTQGDITGQDGWEFSTSLSTVNNRYQCPITVGSPIIPQVSSMPNIVFLQITTISKFMIGGELNYLTVTITKKNGMECTKESYALLEYIHIYFKCNINTIKKNKVFQEELK